MSQSLYIDLHDGNGFRDYTSFWYDAGRFVSDKKDEPRLWDFELVPVPGLSWVQPDRGSYVKFVDTRFLSRDPGVEAGVLYTGYVTDSPDVVTLGARGGEEFVGLSFKCTSDEYLLNLRPCPIRTYVAKSRGAILRDLAQAIYGTSTLPLDLTGIAEGGQENLYQTDATKSWSSVAAEFATADNYTVFAMAGRLFYRPATSPWTVGDTTKSLSISLADPRYTPANRQLSKVANAIVNDVTVVGEDEPRGRVEERWISDGYTGEYRLRYPPFGVLEEVLISDDLTDVLDTSVWSEVDDEVEDYLQVFEGALNVIGGTETYGEVYLVSRKGIEIAGVLETRDGELYFPPTPSGTALLGGLHTAAVPTEATLWCGWKLDMTPVVTPGGPVLDGFLQAVGPAGPISGAIVYLNKAHHYILRKQIVAPPLPAMTPRTSKAGDTYTREPDETGTITITWVIEDIDVTDPANVKKASSTVATLSLSATDEPRFLLYAPVTNYNAHFVLNYLHVRRPPQMTVSTGETRLLQVGSYLDGGRCTVVEEDGRAKLAWYAAEGLKTVGRYYDGVLNQVPAYYWRLNGATDPAIDEGPRSAHLVKHDTVETCDGGIVADLDNLGIAFTGAGHYATAEVILTRAFSLEAIVWTDSDAAKIPIVDGRTDDTHGFLLYLKNGTVAFRLQGVTPSEVLGTIPISDGLKHHVVVVHASLVLDDPMETTTIFVDGIPDVSVTQSFQPGLYATTQMLAVGRSTEIDVGDPTSIYGSFGLDELAIYPTALTADQVADHSDRRQAGLGDVVTIPAQGEEICVVYHRRDKSRARLQAASSIAAEAVLFGDDGVRSKLLGDGEVTPAPRTSEECLQVARAYLADNQGEQWQGSYRFETLATGPSALVVYPRPGDPVAVQFTAGPITVDQTLEVTNVTATFAGSNAYEFQLEFGPVNYFEQVQRALLARRRSSMTDPKIETITVFEDATVDNEYPPPDPIVTVTEIHDGSCGISMGTSLPAGVTGYEVRRSDSAWGLEGYVSRSTSMTRVLARGEHDKMWYIKSYVRTGSPVHTLYSERAASVRVDYPLANAISLTGLWGNINANRCLLVVPWPTDRFFAGIQVREVGSTGKVIYEGDGVTARRRMPGLTMLLENGSFWMEAPNPTAAASMTFWVASYNLRNSMGPATTFVVDVAAPTEITTGPPGPPGTTGLSYNPATGILTGIVIAVPIVISLGGDRFHAVQIPRE